MASTLPTPPRLGFDSPDLQDAGGAEPPAEPPAELDDDDGEDGRPRLNVFLTLPLKVHLPHVPTWPQLLVALAALNPAAPPGVRLGGVGLVAVALLGRRLAPALLAKSGVRRASAVLATGLGVATWWAVLGAACGLGTDPPGLVHWGVLTWSGLGATAWGVGVTGALGGAIPPRPGVEESGASAGMP